MRATTPGLIFLPCWRTETSRATIPGRQLPSSLTNLTSWTSLSPAILFRQMTAMRTLPSPKAFPEDLGGFRSVPRDPEFGRDHLLVAQKEDLGGGSVG